MDIRRYKVEDFVLDPNFKRWVLKPTISDNLYWEGVFEKMPFKLNEAIHAREIIINLSHKKFNLSEIDQKLLWDSIDKDLSIDKEDEMLKIIPLHPVGILKGSTQKHFRNNRQNFVWVKVAVISIMLVFVGALAHSFFTKTVQIEEEPIVYEVKKSEPGVKMQLTLKDGTKVLLNSGSTFRYPKNFDLETRSVFLTGEAYFEIAKDSLRPFIVHSGDSKVTALGTSFIVNAYNTDQIDIALLEGKVAVKTAFDAKSQLLNPGEALLLDHTKGILKKREFNRDKILSWTNKTIFFDKTSLKEAISVLENWYGVKIVVHDIPREEIFFSGKFKEETLKNVLKGLSYASKFKFTINKDKVEIRF
ncbi:FecR family protein [Cyclobacterium amurskyense]|uniref:Anti-FecI sigma factor, FecR n=1 Tax=Cyclobacterium amurskyense TaxID=320787 RepID=A0A0H4PEN8_9BACT|nr:FecR family protein [Cyclobacterium amurskyense]AKP51273.1 Anti-FecI sigma factor, FecR [Cyclobacterium amurskyense]